MKKSTGKIFWSLGFCGVVASLRVAMRGDLPETAAWKTCQVYENKGEINVIIMDKINPYRIYRLFVFQTLAKRNTMHNTEKINQPGRNQLCQVGFY
ncbi:MAG: hypothetical protein HQL91_06235 [Magnetococcales bacterium]|nr:hypothetical protein [Magnetococcales bacterium]